jgi:hypothetical protein
VGLVFRVCLISFPCRLHLERQLFIEAFCQFFDFEVFAIPRTLLRAGLLGCHAQSLPQTGQVDYLHYSLYGAVLLGEFVRQLLGNADERGPAVIVGEMVIFRQLGAKCNVVAAKSFQSFNDVFPIFDR